MSPKSSPRSNAPADTSAHSVTTPAPTETVKNALASLRPHWDRTRDHARNHPRLVKGAASGALAGAALAYFLSGDDGKNDPMLGRPNPADVDALSRVPLSKLVSGWM